MRVWNNREEYFDDGEYIPADSVYDSSVVFVPAYWVSTCPTEDKITFNTKLAKSRVRIEHCIGILKGMWASLRELRNQLRSKDEMESLIKWVVACIILHNMLANIGDVWEELFMDDETPESYNTNADGNTQSTIQMRERILPFVTQM
uniref:DDE Tnp4 domain-containing protein n=1 Tax=Phakopsora pachyrhizi TaxID=170000 RepID=A0A0S1MJ54_PHAPC